MTMLGQHRIMGQGDSARDFARQEASRTVQWGHLALAEIHFVLYFHKIMQYVFIYHATLHFTK